jgi:hypothetical protein
MSVTSILAFVLAGVAARAKSAQVARPSEDRTRELEARVAELEDAIATANVQARRDQELIDIWRERAAGPPPGFGALQPAGPDFRPPQIALQQAAQQLQAQAQMQYAQMQQAQYSNYQQGLGQGLGQAMGLLGAQNLINAELWCNCVPARHDMLLRGE